MKDPLKNFVDDVWENYQDGKHDRHLWFGVGAFMGFLAGAFYW